MKRFAHAHMKQARSPLQRVRTSKSIPYYSVHGIGGQINYILPATNLLLFFKGYDEYRALGSRGRTHDRLRFFVDVANPEGAAAQVLDGIVNTATRGQHISCEGKQRGGPVVHYAFGTLMRGLYGGLAEFCPPVRRAFGTTFGSALFAGADLIAAPVFKLGPAPTDQPKTALASPLAAHIVYGVTTELVRRIVRRII